jgi:transposase
MDYFAGLDVSVKETSICIVDDAGKIVREARVASEPEALLQVLTNTLYRFKRVGLEAGPLSQWLYSSLAEAGLPVICVETRHMRAVLRAQINKTDRNDVRGIAQMMRAGLYRPVHVRALSPGACEDATQSEAADAADPSQAAAVEGHRHRERPARHLAQLRSQGGHGWDGQV